MLNARSAKNPFVTSATTSPELTPLRNTCTLPLMSPGSPQMRYRPVESAKTDRTIVAFVR